MDWLQWLHGLARQDNLALWAVDFYSLLLAIYAAQDTFRLPAQSISLHAGLVHIRRLDLVAGGRASLRKHPKREVQEKGAAWRSHSMWERYMWYMAQAFMHRKCCTVGKGGLQAETQDTV